MFRSRARFAAAVALLLALPTFATTVLQLSPAQVDALATRVVVGQILSARSVTVPGAAFPATEYVIDVDRVLKADGALMTHLATQGGCLVIRQAGGERPDGSEFRIPGIPRYRIGTRYRLALHGDSGLGLTSPVGLGQGVSELAVGAEPRPITVTP